PPPAPPQSQLPLPLPQRLERYEAEIIRQTLAAHHGEVKATLDALGLPRKTFYDKLQRHGIDRQDYLRGSGAQ
ncbi:helix-turn-helix domain-containing protein, partial [Bordetella avium]|uniref:helix-turn-helix domain-containing protein n=1 Tax=Bordetella avium TaxID=521 RepID=UPI00307F2D2F